MCAWHRVWLGNAFGWRCTGNGCCGCVGWSCCCTWPNDHFRIVTLCYDHRPCRWILLTKTIKEEKCVWCNRKLHATEKLKSHYSWNCHFIYFMTWYRLFFFFFFLFFCRSLVPFARLHIVSYLMSNSRFASTQPQRTGWKSRAQEHTHRWTLLLLLKKMKRRQKIILQRQREGEDSLAVHALFRSLASTVYVFTSKIRAVNLFAHVPTNSLTF